MALRMISRLFSLLAFALSVSSLTAASSLSAFAQQATLPAPRSFEAVAVSISEIHCYWLPAQNATGYRLQRDGKTIATLPATAQDYADTGLAHYSVHHYSIVALQGDTASTPREDVDCTFAFLPRPVDKLASSGKELNPVSRN